MDSISPIETAEKSGRTQSDREPRRWTYDELVAEMPETNQPCELWEGELVTSPAPSFFHQQIAFRLQRALHDWVRAKQLGEVIGAPIDMVLSPHRVTQPDVAFISKERLQIIQTTDNLQMPSPPGSNRDQTP